MSNTAKYIDVESAKRVQILLLYRRKKLKTCPNTTRNIDENFTTDVKSAKFVQILLGISTKISQKSQF